MFKVRKLTAFWKSSSFLKGSFIYILGAFLVKGISFILIPLYTSVFSLSEYGTMELINTLMSLLIILVSFGFSQLLYIEFTHLNNDEKSRYVGKINYSFNKIAMPLLLIIALITFLFQQQIFDQDVSVILCLMVTCVYITFYQNNMYAILQLEQQPKLMTYNKIIVATVLLISNVLLVKVFEIGIEAIYISNLLALIISLSLFRLNIRVSNYLTFRRAENNEVSNYVKSGFPFILSSLAYFGINGIDRFIIESFSGKENLGLYSLGFKFGSMLEPLLIVPILSAYNPFVFKKFSQGDYRLYIVRNSIVIIIAFAIIACILPYFASFLIDKKFDASLQLIPLFVMGFAFLFLTQMFAAPLLYLKRKKLLVLNVIVASIINLILNLIFVNLFDILGSAIAFLTTNVFWLILTLYQVHRVKESLVNNNYNIK